VTDLKKSEHEYFLFNPEVVWEEVMKKSDLHVKVWGYVSMYYGHIRNDREELESVLSDIQEGCSWKEKGKKIIPSKKEIQEILDWLVTLENDVRYDD
jgi:hypothetical protein